MTQRRPPPMQKPGTAQSPLVQKALARLINICKGNGVSVRQISIEHATTQDVRFTAGTFFELQPVTEDKILPGRQQAGEVLHDPREVDRMLRDMIERAQRNRSLEETLKSQLLARKDKGFMSEGESLAVTGMDKTVCWHEPCGTCAHTGQVACQTCGGQKYKNCNICHGQTMMQCPLCQGSGTNAGARGPQPCVKCNGMRRVPCTNCGRTGKIPCSNCRGMGHVQCPTCRGQAYSTRVVTLGLRAHTSADYARANVPEHMTFLIENNGGKLVTSGDILVAPEAMQDENKMGIHYNAVFPFADITFSIAKKPVKVEAYGQGKFVRLPHILDQLLDNGIALLQRAASGQGNVAGLLKDAGRYRAIALALVTTIRANAAQTMGVLLKKYPEGLSRECAAEIAKRADRAVAQITRKPRYVGLGIGLALVTGLYAFYYLGPVRAMIAPYIGNDYLNIIIDVMIIFIGGTITTLSIQMSAQGALRKALGHLIPPAKRKTLLPRTHGAGLWGYVAGAIIYLVMIELTRHMENANTPFWYDALMRMIGL